MDQTGGKSPGINLTPSLFLLPLETVGTASLPLTRHSTSTESGLLRTRGSLRTKLSLCQLDLTQPDLVFLVPYHIPWVMGTRE